MKSIGVNPREHNQNKKITFIQNIKYGHCSEDKIWTKINGFGVRISLIFIKYCQIRAMITHGLVGA